MRGVYVLVGVVAVAVAVLVRAEGVPRVSPLTYADLRPLADVLRPLLPPVLAAAAPAEIDAAWRAWMADHARATAERLARGEEDSLVNLWLFGTSFTDMPPARPRDVLMHGGGATLAAVSERRLDDLITALAAPGNNERLRWAAGFLRGKGDARDLLARWGRRAVAENAAFARALETPAAGGDPVAWMAPYASLYRDRGLSSDTSILTSFALDSTLEAVKSTRLIETPVRRVAIVGPGLDVINKADGHDFYPEQTIQPFLLIDSLMRLGLATLGDLTVTTFDVSPRVNQHLADARRRAHAGERYLLHVPLGDAESWGAPLRRYWERAGRHVGDAVRPAKLPSAATRVNVRALRVRPDVVAAVTPVDLNIVTSALDLPEAERFDLMVATNVFIYYDSFEQALAVFNVARMLRPGGALLSNQAVRAVPPLAPVIGHDTVVYSDRQFDHLFWYQRK